MCDGCNEHVKNTRAPASLPRLDLYVGGGGCGGWLLLPHHGINVPLCPLQTEKENGLFSGATEQHFVTHSSLQRSVYSCHANTPYECIIKTIN